MCVYNAQSLCKETISVKPYYNQDTAQLEREIIPQILILLLFRGSPAQLEPDWRQLESTVF